MRDWLGILGCRNDLMDRIASRIGALKITR
jgi:hypothetical protein